MTNLPQTFSSYAVDRRPIADVSISGVSGQSLGVLLSSLYEIGFRRFVVPPFAVGNLWDSSQECDEWRQVISEFVTSCGHPVVVVVRYSLNDHVDQGTGSLNQSFIDYQVVGLFSAGVSGFLSHSYGFGSEPYIGCSHPHLRQLLGTFNHAHIWRDVTQDPYMSVSGSCDLPEWYQAPAEVLAELSPYSGWASEPMRRNVEAVVVIPSDNATSESFSVCSSWGFVPCLQVVASANIEDHSALVEAYLRAENRVKATFARSKKIVISTSGARRMCGDVPMSASFYESEAFGVSRILCPANIDCSHSDHVVSGVPHLSHAACASLPMFDDTLWSVNSEASVSGKLAHASMFGSTGAAKAAELAVEMLADELAAHPDIGYLGELSSVVILSNWGRGGFSGASYDAAFEECRLTYHADDAVASISQSRPLLDSRDTIYNSNGMSACSIWMKSFLDRFDAYRQRLAVFAGCSIPAPWMIMFKSKMQVSTDNAVCSPVSADGHTKYGNWAEQRADYRWDIEEVADFGFGPITAKQFSTFGGDYTCTGYRPDGTISKVFTTADLQSDVSAIDNIGNRPFAKWYGDLARAAAADALSKSVGIMLRSHFSGCAVSCPDLVPGSSGDIVAKEPGKPVFCQTQQKEFSASGVSSTPSIFMAHVGMIAQGHPSLPKVPAGVRLLAKCTTSGSQRPDWYTSSPIGDCSWEYGDQNVPFSYSGSSSSSSSFSYEPSYQKSSTVPSLSAPNAPPSVEPSAHPMRDIYLGSSSISSEAV